MKAHDLPTPALVVDLAALDHNIDVMSEARPGRSLRPHVKAFKSTELARHVSERGGHHSFCAATLRELEGLVAGGVGDDLLLANETLDRDRLAALVAAASARITVAVDSEATIAAAAGTGAAVLIDVNVGLPRCGCEPDDAGRLAETARSAGLEVRGVMGYEGHAVGNPDRAARTRQVERAMGLLRTAHDAVGGDIISAGGTGTYDLHDWAGEVQAGSYLLMDTHYAQLGLPFQQALEVETTVLSVSAANGWAVLDAGLKSFGMDHGNPEVRGWPVFFCSDEHTTITFGPAARGAADAGNRTDSTRSTGGTGGTDEVPARGATAPAVGDRVRMVPAHVDPTVAYHERLHVLDGDDVVDVWPVDLRNW